MRSKMNQKVEAVHGAEAWVINRRNRRKRSRIPHVLMVLGSCGWMKASTDGISNSIHRGRKVVASALQNPADFSWIPVRSLAAEGFFSRWFLCSRTKAEGDALCTFLRCHRGCTLPSQLPAKWLNSIPLSQPSSS